MLTYYTLEDGVLDEVFFRKEKPLFKLLLKKGVARWKQLAFDHWEMFQKIAAFLKPPNIFLTFIVRISEAGVNTSFLSNFIWWALTCQ